MKWILISDKRKPANGEQVVVIHRYHNAEMARYVKGHFLDASGDNNHSLCQLDENIVAWAPLPRVSPKTLARMNDLTQ